MLGDLASPTAGRPGERPDEMAQERTQRPSCSHRESSRRESWQREYPDFVRRQSGEDAAPAPSRKRGHDSEVPQGERPQSGFLHPGTAAPRASYRPHPASSVYLRDMFDVSRPNTYMSTATTGDIDDILNLYRRSTLLPDHFQIYSLDPAEDDSVPPVPQVPAAPARRTSAMPAPLMPARPSQSPPPERNARREDKGKGKKPRPHDDAGLENVTIPRNTYYGAVGADESEFSKQWREMLSGRAPALRVSKKGEVKGPYDADSVYSRDSR